MKDTWILPFAIIGGVALAALGVFVTYKLTYSVAVDAIHDTVKAECRVAQ